MQDAENTQIMILLYLLWYNFNGRDMVQNKWISTKAGMTISHYLYLANSNFTFKCEFQTKLKILCYMIL